MTTQKSIVPHKATHPGTLIKDELEARPELKQKDLAKEIGVKASFLNEIIKGNRPITADIAILLEEALEIPADYWMKFQSQFEIDKARVKEKNINRIKNREIWKVIKEYVPVNYFKKLGYLKDSLEKDIPAIKAIYNVSSVDDLVTTFAGHKLSFYRKSEKLQVDEKNMLAWSSLAMYEAKQQSVSAFNPENINQLCQKLNTIFFENDNTIEKVKSTLNQFGIKLVQIEKLDKTPVDGFSFWSENNPAIALTLRHKRIDNFAFTLMHEIAHIYLHITTNKEKSFLDLTLKNSKDVFESEADQFAQERLIPEDCWKNIKSNKLPPNDDKLLEVSHNYQIHPAILLGRISYEMNHYALKTEIDKRLN
ncbi:HigA family addiction module antitoxin [Natronoflexus pectinivorans]|uniref:HTH-type transcriptional regulator/antitoxin HigA n=1 Tax=Natronoflexus pectinivorans TaxID=682526 RepID=A0A4R2GP09_9BACT|nr:HigA family addiction module antitoxin [Natronoflexus pectinivorans]TCO10850.1 HTH-type transcriptional regulator/antitoxin HigA [Natronoflexus pectinivorans]